MSSYHTIELYPLHFDGESANSFLQAKKKKLCLFPVTRPTLIFGPDPKVFIALDDKMR